MKEHIKTCAMNVTYKCWKMQDYILNTYDDFIPKTIVSRIHSAKCFSILADETTDISTSDIFSLCVRHVDETK